MKTAVEWYNSKVIELMTQREQGNIDVLEFRNQLDLLLTQANKMFEEQIINAASDHCYPTGELARIDAEDYYNETFKSE
jgi:uncharacterized protein (DUF1919 family)